MPAQQGFSSVSNNMKVNTGIISNESSTEEVELSLPNPLIDEFGRIYSTGRRKTSVARVWLKEGSGQFTVNDKPFIEYFQPVQRMSCLEPFKASKTACMYDVWCTVKGGGIAGNN
jgi:small subunit ribosomal protein S9